MGQQEGVGIDVGHLQCLIFKKFCYLLSVEWDSVKAPLKVDTFLLTVFVRRKVCKSKLAKPCRTNERVAPKGHRNAVNPRVVRHG